MLFDLINEHFSEYKLVQTPCITHHRSLGYTDKFIHTKCITHPPLPTQTNSSTQNILLTLHLHRLHRQTFLHKMYYSPSLGYTDKLVLSTQNVFLTLPRLHRQTRPIHTKYIAHPPSASATQTNFSTQNVLLTLHRLHRQTRPIHTKCISHPPLPTQTNSSYPHKMYFSPSLGYTDKLVLSTQNVFLTLPCLHRQTRPIHTKCISHPP